MIPTVVPSKMMQQWKISLPTYKTLSKKVYVFVFVAGIRYVWRSLIGKYNQAVKISAMRGDGGVVVVVQLKGQQPLCRLPFYGTVSCHQSNVGPAFIIDS